jgi:glycolate oxidase iron-sulfur subunit
MTREKTRTDPLTACVRCGKCLAACPLYRVDPSEPLSPRGRTALAESLIDGSARPTDRAGEILYRCLLCGACATACPRGTPTVGMMAAARELLARRGHVKPIARLAMATAASPRVRGGLLTGMRAFRRLLFSRLPNESGLRLRFAGRMVGIPDRILPVIPDRSLLEESGAEKPREVPGETVAIFTGCMVNHLLPDIGRATAELVRRAGMTPYFPAGQGCCGMMFWGEGETTSARRLAETNARLLIASPFSRLVVPCASCRFALTTLYPEFLADDPPLAAAWQRLLPKITTLSAFAVESGAAMTPVTPGITVTWHDPCHLGATREPRELIRSIPGVTLREMAHPDRCCGSGGLFTVLNPALSGAVGDAKVDDILATGADAVVTECPGCMLQIKERLARKGSAIPVLHPAELAVSGVKSKAARP